MPQFNCAVPEAKSGEESMSNEHLDHDYLQRFQKEMFTRPESEKWDNLSSKQKKFLGLLEAKQSGDFFTVCRNGCSAVLVAKDEAVRIANIETSLPERGNGHASHLLETICSCADDTQVTLLLTVEPNGLVGLDEELLSKWYRKHGFAGDASAMIRQSMPLSKADKSKRRLEKHVNKKKGPISRSAKGSFTS